MLRRSKAELILFFLLGIGVFGIYESIASFQSLNCSYQQEASSNTQPYNNRTPTQKSSRNEGHDESKNSIHEPFVCSIFGFPSAARIFANHNEGAVVGFFTMLLVFATVWLVRATEKLWRGAEDTAQRQLRAYISVVVGQGWRQGGSKGLKFEFRPNIVNIGQTPAYSVNIASNMRFLSYAEAATYDFAADIPKPEIAGVLALGREQHRFMRVILDRTLSKPELRLYREGMHALFVFGTVKYIDTFKLPRQTNFCFAISAWNKRTPPDWTTTYRHNESD